MGCSLGRVEHEWADRVRRAAEALHNALYPGPDIAPRDDLDPRVFEKLNEAQNLLGKAENELDTGLSGAEPNVDEGVRLAQEAWDALEFVRALMKPTPREVYTAWADSLRLLDPVVGHG